MAQRFEKLFNLTANLYCDDSPVIISAGSLLKDNNTENIITQLKFQSVSVSPIKALKIDLSAFDVTGKEISGVIDYQYLDLNVHNGQFFGANKAIIMPMHITRSFTIKKITVVFADGVLKELVGEWRALPKERFLQTQINLDLIQQYRATTTEKSHYVPQELGELWQCSCGKWNKGKWAIGNKCTECWVERHKIFEEYDIPKLEMQLRQQIAAEEADRAERVRLAELAREEELKNKLARVEKRNAIIAKIKRIVKIVLIVILISACIATSILLFSYMGVNMDVPQESTTHISTYEALSINDVFTFSAGGKHVVGIKYDGTVVAAGSNISGQCDVIDWNDIVAVSAGDLHTIGLKQEGTVVAVGYDGYGQCDVNNWTDIIAISAGYRHTVGLKADGTVVATGYNAFGQCDVNDWTNIVAVNAGELHTIGLKQDGTVVAVGYDGYGQCDVNNWSDIVSISANYYHTVGLKSDGTVVAAGFNKYGQINVSEWDDIVAVSTGELHTVGLKHDGTVVTVGSSNNGMCDISDWRGIAAISADRHHTVGLKIDGTVVVAGSNDYSQCDVSGWENIKSPEKLVDYDDEEYIKLVADTIPSMEYSYHTDYKEQLKSEIELFDGVMSAEFYDPNLRSLLIEYYNGLISQHLGLKYRSTGYYDIWKDGLERRCSSLEQLYENYYTCIPHDQRNLFEQYKDEYTKYQ